MAEQRGEEPTDAASYAELSDALGEVEAFLLGGPPTLTRVQVADRAGVPLDVAQELWRLMGFAHQTDDAVAFSESDVQALRLSVDLMQMGILSPDSQAALVRTWGRSYARLAEWQTELLAGLAVEGPDPDVRLAELATGVLPRVEALQSYVWRRHLASAASRLVSVASPHSPEVFLAVGFVDIVGYTTHSKTMAEGDLVEWIEHFEQEATGVVTDLGGRVIKTIGDEILYTADDPVAAAEIALELTGRGRDEDDPFPSVRAGLAYGEVVSRLGDVFGPTVNIAARLTSVARPGTVVVDQGAYAALSGDSEREPADDERAQESADDERAGDQRAGAGAPDDGVGGGGAGTSGASGDGAGGPAESPYAFKRLRRVSVKGYAKLRAWRLRRSADA